MFDESKTREEDGNAESGLLMKQLTLLSASPDPRPTVGNSGRASMVAHGAVSPLRSSSHHSVPCPTSFLKSETGGHSLPLALQLICPWSPIMTSRGLFFLW